MTDISPFRYKKTLITFISLLLIFLIIVNVFIVSDQRQQHLKEIHAHYERQVDLIGTFIREPLLKHNYGKVEAFLEHWAGEHDEIIEFQAVMPNSFLLVDYKRARPSNHFITIGKSVAYAGIPLVTLTLIMDMTEEEKIMTNLRLHMMFGSTVLLIILAGLLWFSIRKMALKPLEQEVAVRKETEKLLRTAQDQLETKVRERTAELKEREYRLQTIIETEPECLKIIDSAGALVTMNPAGLKMIEADSLEQVRGKDMCVVMKEEYRDQFRELRERVFGGDEGNLKFEIVGLKGTHRWLDTHAVPLRDANNTIQGMLAVTRDISDWKDAQIALGESEERYRMVFQKAPLGIIHFSVDGKATDCNDKFAEIIGAPKEKVLAVNLVTAVRDEKMKSAIMNVVHGREGHYEGEYLSVAGEKRTPIKADFAPLLSGKGDVLGGIGVFEDISSRMKAEKELLLSEEKFSKAFRSSPTFITISTLKEGRYIDVNDTFLEQSGYSREEIIGHSALELGIWTNPADRAVMIDRLQREGSVYNMEILLRMKHGGIVTVLYSAEMITIESEQCLLAVKLNITDRKQLEIQLAQSQRMEAVGQLAGGVAHDFNNILTAIISNVYLIKNHAREGDPSRELADKVIALSNNAAKIVQELLVFSRKQKAHISRIHLNDVVRSAESLLSNFLGRGIQILTDLEEAGLFIMGDISQLEQVIINLATNARDAMPEGGILTIKTGYAEMHDSDIKNLGTGKQGAYALLSVADTGTGMDRETREKMFEPFFTTKEVGKGTGLGLSIVYGIIEQHKGFLTVSSVAGKGTTFNIYIPLAESKADA